MQRSLFHDITAGVVDFWAARLKDCACVHTAYPDGRLVTRDKIEYPAVSIMLLSADIAKDRRYGGIAYCVTDTNMGAGTAKVRPLPIPIDISFQLDTLAKSRVDDWSLEEQILYVLAAQARTPVTTKDERKIFMEPVPGQLDSGDWLNTETLWRKAYRFKVQVWLENTEAYEQVAILKQVILDINQEQYTEVFNGG